MTENVERVARLHDQVGAAAQDAAVDIGTERVADRSLGTLTRGERLVEPGRQRWDAAAELGGGVELVAARLRERRDQVYG